ADGDVAPGQEHEQLAVVPQLADGVEQARAAFAPELVHRLRARRGRVRSAAGSAREVAHTPPAGSKKRTSLLARTCRSRSRAWARSPPSSGAGQPTVWARTRITRARPRATRATSSGTRRFPSWPTHDT